MIPSKLHLPLISTTATTSIATISFITCLLWMKNKKKKTSKDEDQHQNRNRQYEDCIGQTPLIHLQKLSSIISNGHSNGKKIYAKMECFNPGGTGKDRAALYMLRHAEDNGDLPPPQHQLQNQRDIKSNGSSTSSANKENDDNNNTHNLSISNTISIAISRSQTGGIVVEGTSGSTGISLSTLSTQRGHSVIIVMPDDQSKEKQTILKCLGAVLHVVPTASISNPNHYVNVARKISEEINKRYGNATGDATSNGNINGKNIKAAFMNQFENEANYKAHYSTTGPEIWNQTNGEIDAFCMSSGTGGTISGVGQYLKNKYNEKYKKEQTETKTHQCKIILIDPPGSVLYNKVKYNIAYATEQRERNLLRHRYDTIAEGIGLDRITNNFALGVDNGVIDDAIRVSDQNAVDVAHWLLKEEGLFVGSSSAMNVCGAIRFAVSGEDGNDGNNCNDDAHSVSTCTRSSCIVAVICDGGQRHLTRFWNRDFIIDWDLLWPSDDEIAWKNRLDVIFNVNSSTTM